MRRTRPLLAAAVVSFLAVVPCAQAAGTQLMIGVGRADITTVTAASTYSITHFVFGSAKQVFRVKVPGDPANQAVSSATFPIEVTPAPAGTLRPKPQAVLPH